MLSLLKCVSRLSSDAFEPCKSSHKIGNSDSTEGVVRPSACFSSSTFPKMYGRSFSIESGKGIWPAREFVLKSGVGTGS